MPDDAGERSSQQLGVYVGKAPKDQVFSSPRSLVTSSTCTPSPAMHESRPVPRPLVSEYWNRNHWEVQFSQATVVFSTGLVLAQIFGGKGIMQLVKRDEVMAVDMLCEWQHVSELDSSENCPLVSLLNDRPTFSSTDSGEDRSVNSLTGQRNLRTEDLLPQQGVFSVPPWKGRLCSILSVSYYDDISLRIPMYCHCRVAWSLFQAIGGVFRF
eukprot:Lankesteria_metandrocarpae@DN947_c0_g1_i2.p1